MTKEEIKAQLTLDSGIQISGNARRVAAFFEALAEALESVERSEESSHDQT